MRPARASIDLAALRANYRLARRSHGGRALAVIKADAYGHGAVRCAEALADVADGFAVAFMDEALTLREAGIRAPVLVLEGAFGPAELDAAASAGIWVVAHQASQLEQIAALPRGRLHVWLKVDSGMHRAGFAPHAVGVAHARLLASPAVAEVVLMSHFARADEPGDPCTAEQIATFDAATAGLPGARSLCNSAGVVAWPDARRDWARPGIMLYGAAPVPGTDPGLRPVMRLSAEVFATRELRRGEPLGYGGAFRAPHDMRIGLVALGYADGYPRSAPAGTPVRVDGAPTRLVGRVSMDMLTVDLTPTPTAGVGSEVELWGPGVDVGTVASLAGTIAYELLCNVKRVPRHYLGGAASWVGSVSPSGPVASRPNSIQSSPKVSQGCWVRSDPLPQRRESAGQ